MPARISPTLLFIVAAGLCQAQAPSSSHSQLDYEVAKDSSAADLLKYRADVPPGEMITRNNSLRVK